MPRIQTGQQVVAVVPEALHAANVRVHAVPRHHRRLLRGGHLPPPDRQDADGQSGHDRPAAAAVRQWHGGRDTARDASRTQPQRASAQRGRHGEAADTVQRDQRLRIPAAARGARTPACVHPHLPNLTWHESCSRPPHDTGFHRYAMMSLAEPPQPVPPTLPVPLAVVTVGGPP